MGGGYAYSGADATSKSSTKTDLNLSVKVDVKVEIQNLLGHTGMIKDRIARDLKIEGENQKEIDYALSDVDMAEEALVDIESAQAAGNEPEPKSKSKLGEFIDDLSDEESTIHKTLKKLRKGRDYGVKLAETYNKIAGNIGMPIVPPAALEIIKSI